MPGTHTAGGSTHSARPEPQRPQGTETALQPGFLRRARLRPLGCFTEMPAGSSGVQASPHGAASMVPRVGAGGGSGASRDPRTRLGGAGKVPEAHGQQPVPRVWAGSRLYKEKAPVEELQTGSSKRIKCRVWRPVNAERGAEAAPRQSRRSVQQSWARRGRRAQGPMGCPAPLTEQGSPGEREAEGPPPRAVWRPRGGGAMGHDPQEAPPTSLPCPRPRLRVTPSHSQRQTPRQGCTRALMALALRAERPLSHVRVGPPYRQAGASVCALAPRRQEWGP